MKASILRLRYNIEWHQSGYISENDNENTFKKYPYEKDINTPPAIQNPIIKSKLSLLINQLRQISIQACNNQYANIITK